MRLPGINTGVPRDLNIRRASTPKGDSAGAVLPVFRQSGDVLTPVGEFRATQHGEQWSVEPTGGQIILPSVNRLGMRVMAPLVKLPDGTESQLTIGMTVEGVLLVQAKGDTSNQTYNERQMLRFVLAIVRKQLNINLADITAVVFQMK